MRTSTAPVHINCLPNEILSEIFMHARGEAIDVVQGLGSIGVLQQVCVRWRAVVTCTEWSKTTTFIRLQTCLKFSSPPANMKSQEPLAITNDDIMKAIVKHTHRWVSLSLQLGSMFDDEIVVLGLLEESVQEQDLAQLRLLSLKMVSSKAASRIFRNAMALEEVVLKLMDVSDTFTLPWDNVKRLTLDTCIGNKPLIPMLCKMSRLEALSLNRVLNDILASPESFGTVTFPLLHTLAISCYEIRKFCPILDVPRLSSIRLFTSAISEEDISCLFEMVNKSGCTIKRLQIDYMAASPVIRAIRLFVTLKNFLLSGRYDDDFLSIEDIMRSRSSSVADKNNCCIHVTPDRYSKNESAVDQLKNLAEVLGIELEVALEKLH
ncbi:hypothetical protein BDQ17DRAFT_1348491 [Cyathus striatus]|nr:hypothetical protein BDQ17DRAFT_1348491 [Cyathus striatus]